MWQEIKKKKKIVSCLAPMDEITDFAFRQAIARFGKPDVLFTEFISADGIIHPDGFRKLSLKLKFKKNERPIVAQIFSAYPEKIYEAAKIIKKLKFDALDINMGCPDKKIIKQGAGAALINNPQVAKEIIKKAKEGAFPLDISIKTRIGFNEINFNWIKNLLEEKPQALIIHLRTKKELSKITAHWEIMKEIVKIKNKISPKTIIIGNGDIKSLEEGRKKVKETKCDGFMIGRGIFNNPFLFSRKKQISLKDKIKMLLFHLKIFERNYGEKRIHIFRKFFKVYISNFSSACEIRNELMKSKNFEEIKKTLKFYFKIYKI